MSALPWTYPPLILVTALVQFDVVLSLKDRFAQVQDTLRKQGFLGAEEFQQQTWVQQVRPDGLHFGQQVQTFWSYSDREVRRVFTVNEQQLVYATSHYLNFETFLEEYRQGLHAILTAIEGDVPIRQVGMRYTDWLEGTPELPLEEQVDTRLLGFPLEGAQGAETLNLAAEGRVGITFRASRGSLATNALQEFMGQKPRIARLNNAAQALESGYNHLVLDVQVNQANGLEEGPRTLLSETPTLLTEFHGRASYTFQNALSSAGFKHYRGF